MLSDQCGLCVCFRDRQLGLGTGDAVLWHPVLPPTHRSQQHTRPRTRYACLLSFISASHLEMISRWREVMPFIPATFWHIDKPFVSPSKRMCLPTKDRKLHSVIMHNIIFANQNTEYCFVSQDTHTCSVWGNMLFRICHWTSYQAFFQHVNCMMGCARQTEA